MAAMRAQRACRGTPRGLWALIRIFSSETMIVPTLEGLGTGARTRRLREKGND
jgi:hypothetical protein